MPIPDEVGKLLNTSEGKEITGRELTEMLAQATVVPEAMSTKQVRVLEWYKDAAGPSAKVGLIDWNAFLALLKERIEAKSKRTKRND